jgi:F0F1-type ATP synthase assembly protein I
MLGHRAHHRLQRWGKIPNVSRSVFLAICLVQVVSLSRTGHAQGATRREPDVGITMPTGETIAARNSMSMPAPLVSLNSARAGIARPSSTLDEVKLANDREQASERNDRVKHAAIGAGIGAGVGLVVGAAIGWQMDRTNQGTIPATPIIAVEGAAIGFVAGAVIGALVR